MILRARTILPVSQPPIENGAVVISGNRIRAVGSWPDLRPSRHGKGLRPRRSRPAARPHQRPLPSRLHRHGRDVAAAENFHRLDSPHDVSQSQWEHADYARSWLNGARHAPAHRAPPPSPTSKPCPTCLPEVWNATPLRVFSFLEMTGIRARRDPAAMLREAVEKIDSLSHPRCSAALSPHAPYSTLPELLRLSARAARKRALAALHPRRGIRAGI